MKIFSIFPSQGKSIACQSDRRIYDLPQRQFSVLFQSEDHASHRAGHPYRLVSNQAGLRDHVALRIEIHVRGSGARSFFAVVDEAAITTARADQHETATA